MESNHWIQLIRHNCSQLLSQAISNSAAAVAAHSKDTATVRTRAHSRQPYSAHRDTHSSTPDHSPHSRTSSADGPNLFENTAGKHSITEPNSSLYQSALESVPPDEQLSSLLRRDWLQNSKRLDPSNIFIFSTSDEDNDTTVSSSQGATDFTETLSPQQEHIIQSHSESARNALIYIAVILAIYLVAVAFIAVQYYRKHSTLDPVTAYLLRRSTRRQKDARSAHSRKHRRRYSASGGGSSFDNNMRSACTSSSLGLRNGSSSGMNGDGCTLGPGTSTTSCSGVRFEQQATVYGENGTTIKALDLKCPNIISDIKSSNGTTPPQPILPPHQVSIQINIEPALDDDIEESNVEDDYYDEDEEEDEDEEDDDDEDEFEEEEMAVLATNESDTSRAQQPLQQAHPSKAQRLKNLFTHFHSHSVTESGSSNKGVHNPGHSSFSPTHKSSCGGVDNHLATINNGKTLTRSSSLQATDVPSSCPGGGGVGHIDTETGSWKPSEIDLLKFKRSSIAGFTVAASTGPLGMFKTSQQRHYEETHL